MKAKDFLISKGYEFKNEDGLVTGHTYKDIFKIMEEYATKKMELIDYFQFEMNSINVGNYPPNKKTVG